MSEELEKIKTIIKHLNRVSKSEEIGLMDQDFFLTPEELKRLVDNYYLWSQESTPQKESGFIIVTGVRIEYCSQDFFGFLLSISLSVLAVFTVSFMYIRFLTLLVFKLKVSNINCLTLNQYTLNPLYT